MLDRDRLLLFSRLVKLVNKTAACYKLIVIQCFFILGVGMCFILSCFYVFVAIAKICQREHLSCLFQSVKESEGIHQALEIKRSTKCQMWRISEKSLISFQDSYFVVDEQFDKEKVNLTLDSAMNKIIYLTCKD